VKAPEFTESFAIADSAASQFVATYPSSEESRTLRGMLRYGCVPALRWLWRNGDAFTRVTIAARIAVWREIDRDRVSVIQRRIREREEQRPPSVDPVAVERALKMQNVAPMLIGGMSR
jgi:hypothetical protein